MRRPTRSGSEHNAATFLALLGLLVIAGGLLVLAAMVTPSVLGILVVVGGFFLFGAFHYLVWGHWLSKPQPQDDEEPS